LIPTFTVDSSNQGSLKSSPTPEGTWKLRFADQRQRYRIERCLGRGGMGEIYLATDTLLGKPVALKLSKASLSDAQQLRERFEQEVNLCAALQSIHVVQVSDYGITPEGCPFFVMEYLEGQTLAQVLQRERQLSVQRAIAIAQQICSGLRLAHQGILLQRQGASQSEFVQFAHRDLKPDNIFLVPMALGELVKILDFGVAEIVSHPTIGVPKSRTFAGTFRYAAPEQLSENGCLDGRVDIYGLGLLLYEMLSGVDPFGLGQHVSDSAANQWFKAHLAMQPLPLLTQPGCECLPAALEAVVLQCLQKQPCDRYATVDELSYALQQIVVGTPNPEPVPQNRKQQPEGSSLAIPADEEMKPIGLPLPPPLTDQATPTQIVPQDEEPLFSSVTAAPINRPNSVTHPDFKLDAQAVEMLIELASVMQPDPSVIEADPLVVSTPTSPQDLRQHLDSTSTSHLHRKLEAFLLEAIGPIAPVLLERSQQRTSEWSELITLVGQQLPKLIQSSFYAQFLPR
jgi:eukaryotic-like serine/threonine-protein kinase